MFSRQFSADGDPYWDKVVLLAYMDGADGGTTFTDSSKTGRTITRTTVTTETEQSISGGSSAFFDGNVPTRLTYAGSSNLDFGANDFTIDGWIRPSTVTNGTARFVFDKRQSWANKGIAVNQTAADSSKLRLSCGDSNTAAFDAVCTATTSMVANTWYYFEVGRQGSNFYLFMNGTLEGTATWAGTIDDGTGNDAYSGIGTDLNTGPFFGYIENLRVTMGVCRHTASYTGLPTRPQNWG